MRLSLSCFLLLVVGCAKPSLHPNLPPGHEVQSSVIVDVANASRGAITPDIEKRSTALHHFLVGQLSLNREDYKGALENFRKTESLNDDPAPLLHTKLADLYVRFGELDKALVASQKAMQESPSDPYAQLLYAGILEGLNRGVEAEPVYRKLVEEYPSKFDAYVLLANLYAKQQRYAEGIQVLQSLTMRDPEDPLGHYYLGRMYEQMQRWDLAEAEYLKVMEKDPTLTNGSTELLRVLLNAKKTDQAKALCGRIIEKDPNSAIARKVLSHLMLGESRLDEALQHLEVLKDVESDATDTHFKIALIQLEKQNYKEALRELNLVVAKNPKHAEARYYLASIYAGSGRRKEAVEELVMIEKGDEMFVKGRTFAAFILRQDDNPERARDLLKDALEMQPGDKNLVLYLVVVLRDLKDFAQAEQLLQEALVKSPDDERLLFNLGLVFHDQGREESAVACMERLIQLNPRNADALNYVAYSLADGNGDLVRAERLIRQALELRPNEGYYLDTLGWIQYRSGALQAAQETLERAMSLSGEDAVIVEHYVEVLLARGEKVKAISVLKSVKDRSLSERERADQERVAARERLIKRLKDLLRSDPELDSVGNQS